MLRSARAQKLLRQPGGDIFPEGVVASAGPVRDPQGARVLGDVGTIRASGVVGTGEVRTFKLSLRV